jgi:hypothetical protein
LRNFQQVWHWDAWHAWIWIGFLIYFDLENYGPSFLLTGSTCLLKRTTSIDSIHLKILSCTVRPTAGEPIPQVAGEAPVEEFQQTAKLVEEEVAPQGSQMEAGETPSRNLNAEIR